MSTRIRQMKAEEGFTLVELLIVIVVLGVLAGVTVLAVGGVDKRGVAAACRSDFKSIEVAQQAHFAKATNFALDVPDLVTKGYLASAPAPKGYTIATNNSGKVFLNPPAPPASWTASQITACDALSENVAG